MWTLDEKCQDDWGNPELSTFKAQVRAKFEANLLLINSNKKWFHKFSSDNSMPRKLQFHFKVRIHFKTFCPTCTLEIWWNNP